MMFVFPIPGTNVSNIDTIKVSNIPLMIINAKNRVTFVDLLTCFFLMDSISKISEKKAEITPIVPINTPAIKFNERV